MTFTATVTPAAATGVVTFSGVGSANLQNGIASITISSLTSGTTTVTAQYNGDGNDSASSSTALTQTVKSSSTTTITSNPNPSALGQSVTFTAAVTPSSASGAVQFFNGASLIGTATLSSGTATLVISSLPQGANSITAAYGGNSSTTASASAVLTQTVNAIAPGAPSSLTAAAVSATQINLAWTASPTSGVTYAVYASTTAGFTPSTANRIATGISTTSYSDTGLTGSKAYFFRVSALNSVGESGSSNQATATTQGVTACHVSYSVTSQWNNGFNGAFSIQNTGSSTMTSWTVTWAWAANEAVTSAWNATYKQTGANVTMTNMSYNNSIAPGATLSGMGFGASYSGTNPTPTVFYVNGTLCH